MNRRRNFSMYPRARSISSSQRKFGDDFVLSPGLSASGGPALANCSLKGSILASKPIDLSLQRTLLVRDKPALIAVWVLSAAISCDSR